MTTRNLVGGTALALGLLTIVAPSAVAGFDADCGVELAPGVQANCGRIDSESALNCVIVAGGLSCTPTYTATITISRWVNAGSVSAAMSGDCADSNGASWPGPLVALTLPLACAAPNVFVPGGTCHTFSVDTTADFAGLLPPRPLATSDGGTVCPA